MIEEELQVIEEELRSIEVEVEQSKRSSDYTLVLRKNSQKKYCYSKYSPRQDAIREIEDGLKNKETLWICFGFGMGYILDYLHNKVGDEANVIVIEPSQDALDKQLIIRRDIEIKENTHLVTGTNFEEVEKKIANKITIDTVYNIRIISIPLYVEYYSKYYKYIMNMINNIRSNMAIEYNTTSRFAEKHLHNILENREPILDSYDISKYRKKYQGIPAVIVSAGPSLDKNIHNLSEFEGLIFTGGRSVGTILDQQKKPHFVCSIDPQDIAYDILDKRFLEGEIPLVTCPSGNSKVVSQHKGKKYFVDLGERGLKELIGKELERIPVGGSVATLCISLAYYMGCNPIILIGQDLAYTNLKTHSDNCLGKAINVESEQYKKVKGYYGQDVYSDAVLLTYLRWIENFIKDRSDTKFINATEGGALINYMENKPFKDVVELYRDVEIASFKAEKLYDIDEDLAYKLQNMVDALEEIKVLAKQGEELSYQLRKIFVENKSFKDNEITDRVIDINTELDKIDQKVLDIGGAYEICMEMFTAIYKDVEIAVQFKAGIDETDREEGIRVSSKSYELYRRLAWAAEETKKILRGEKYE